MKTQPILTTRRLVLRPFTPADAPDLQRHASRREIADTMISVPHPLPDGAAARFIVAYAEDFQQGRAAHFAMTLRRGGKLVGAVELRAVEPEHAQAELSLWVATERWGKGYATEAVRAVLDFGFEQLGLNRVVAHHMVRNPASGSVMAKTGFRTEGLLRQRVRKWGVFEDVVLLSLLRQDWAGRR